MYCLTKEKKDKQKFQKKKYKFYEAANDQFIRKKRMGYFVLRQRFENRSNIIFKDFVTYIVVYDRTFNRFAIDKINDYGDLGYETF